ncbi:FAD-dependent monooxygenase [Streptomyces sp. NPDC047042]|uniref:FAD-dependent monooxygenase n=1 Tax=Streptomyces sp. NPDC047042 TaxID=3154807 RepID=UPI0033FA1002
MSEQKRGTRIAIVGGGITGLALAAALNRFGIGCEVYEQAQELGEVGAGIQLSPNAVRLLHRIGLAESLAGVSVRSAAMELRTWQHGEVIGRVPLDRCEERFGAPYYLLSRPDLHRSLLRLLPPGTVRLSMACTGVEDRADGAELRFSDGTFVTADLVVGADGIRSKVREHLVRDEPRYSGQTVYRGLAPAHRAPFLGAEPGSVIWAGPGRHFVCYPVASGRLVNFVATVPSADWFPESWSQPGEVQEVLKSFTGWDPAVRQIIEATDTVTRWALHLRDADFGWSRGRVTLAGDAAHPMLPFMAQGANQAIEDAFALAACLRQAPADGVPAALRRYEAARRPRTALVQQRSADMAHVFHDPDGPRPTPGHSPSSDEGGALSAFNWLFGHDAEQGLVRPPA